MSTCSPVQREALIKWLAERSSHISYVLLALYFVQPVYSKLLSSAHNGAHSFDVLSINLQRLAIAISQKA